MRNILSIDTNEPGGVYLSTHKQKLQKRRDKAKRNQLLNERKTMISEVFWDKFVTVAKACYMHDEEADLYDVFEIYRTKMMGGWENTPEQLAKLDEVIAQEELKRGYA